MNENYKPFFGAGGGSLAPKMSSHFWGPHEPSGFDSHIHVQDLLNKKNLHFTRRFFLARQVIKYPNRLQGQVGAGYVRLQIDSNFTNV